MYPMLLALSLSTVSTQAADVGAQAADAPPPPATVEAAPVEAAPVAAPVPAVPNADVAVAAKKSTLHTVAITTDIISLLTDRFQLSIETRLSDRIGASLLLGAGAPNTDTFGRVTYIEVGGQLTTYPIGNFDHGLQLGAEARGLKVLAAERNLPDDANIRGYETGAFLGYKYTESHGLVLNVQGGVSYVISGERFAGAQLGKGSVLPLANVSLGFAF